jgi:hypothetical protein
MKKIIYIDGSVNAAAEHCKTYIITFRGSKTKSEYIYLIRHIDVTGKKNYNLYMQKKITLLLYFTKKIFLLLFVCKKFKFENIE